MPRSRISVAAIVTLDTVEAGVDTIAQFDAAVELLERWDVDIRREHLGGGGGGLCSLRGRRIVFIDLDADIPTRLEQTLRALAGLPELESAYVTPALRELIEQLEV